NGCDPLHFSSGAVHRSLKFRRFYSGESAVRAPCNVDAIRHQPDLGEPSGAPRVLAMDSWRGGGCGFSRRGQVGKDINPTLRFMLSLSVALRPIVALRPSEQAMFPTICGSPRGRHALRWRARLGLVL